MGDHSMKGKRFAWGEMLAMKAHLSVAQQFVNG